MAIGKLYRLEDEFIVDVNYQLRDESQRSWWGELILAEYRRLKDGDGYVIELEDGRRGSCSIRKRVNRAVDSIPPLYRYLFRGKGLLK